jgi:hypothetical protein
MKQLEIEFFWPLTEQIPLDLDYKPCQEYDEQKQKQMWSSITSTNGVLVGSTFTLGTTLSTVTPTLQFRPEPDCVGWWEINKDVHVWRKHRPNWLHQKMTKVFFGWEWKDK